VHAAHKVLQFLYQKTRNHFATPVTTNQPTAKPRWLLNLDTDDGMCVQGIHQGQWQLDEAVLDWQLFGTKNFDTVPVSKVLSHLTLDVIRCNKVEQYS